MSISRWILAGAVVGTLFVVGYLPKQRAREALAASAAQAENVVPTVNVVRGKPNPAGKTLTLPATLRGWEQTVVLSRANGYVKNWQVDLGASVEAGQLLAELDTPELDREVEQARASHAESAAVLKEAQASRDFARINQERFASLTIAGVASQGDLQKAQAEAQVADAKVGVAEASRASRLANLRRLEQLKSFAKVSAPFAGVITARKIERGSLVSAGTSALFELAAVEPLRVVVDVPQSLALGVKAGLSGTVRARELPSRSFPATVARTSGSLDAGSRTLRVELTLPNPERALLPGMFAELSLALDRKHATLSLPASAVINGKDGLRVATVDSLGIVHLRPIVLERDNGSELEIASGLAPTDDVVASPRPFLHDGERVKPSSAKP